MIWICIIYVMGSVCGEGIAVCRTERGIKGQDRSGGWRGLGWSVIKARGNGLADSVGATSFPQICVCRLPQHLQKFQRVTSAPETLLWGQVEVDTWWSFLPRGNSLPGRSWVCAAPPGELASGLSSALEDRGSSTGKLSTVLQQREMFFHLRAAPEKQRCSLASL